MTLLHVTLLLPPTAVTLLHANKATASMLPYCMLPYYCCLLLLPYYMQLKQWLACYSARCPTANEPACYSTTKSINFGSQPMFA